jgi:hypothetical protein
MVYACRVYGEIDRLGWLAWLTEQVSNPSLSSFVRTSG